MIIVRLFGGMGNQLFQYAAGRRLACVLGTELKLDTSWFDQCGERQYSLGHFNIQESFAHPDEVAAMTTPTMGRRIIAKLRRRKPLAPTHIKEKHFHFSPRILTLPDGVCLEGYWQSEKYFADIAAVIRRDLTVKHPQTGRNKEWGEMIASSESVSLHVRHGDYVANPNSRQIHGVLDLDYYLGCAQEIMKALKTPHFFIFSDDPDWVRNNMSFSCPATLVEHGEDKLCADIEDLRLMSQCKHHIIANSSFSWWGAWLNPRSDKMVFAPRQWFTRMGMASRKTHDLLPDCWIISPGMDRADLRSPADGNGHIGPVAANSA
jgi:hypothetical protein